MRNEEEVKVGEALELWKTLRNIEKWGDEKGITDPVTQTAKLLEEAGEVAHETTRGNYRSEALIDGIGDVIVVATILAKLCNTTVEQCVQHAYAEIKDRKGKVVHGGFVKDEN